MPVALITGATGFCASHLIARLKSSGEVRVMGIGRQASPPANMGLDEYVQVSLADPQALSSAIQRIRPDYIYHLAGSFRGSHEELYRANLLCGVNLLEAVRNCSPESRVLIVGSAAEYGALRAADLPVREEHICRPTGPYALSKYALTMAAQSFVREHQLKIVIARPFNILGPGIPDTLVVGAILRRVQAALASGADPKVAVGNLDTVRDFVAAQDVVDAYIQLLHGEWWGEVFNICSGAPKSIREVVESILAWAPRQLHLEISRSLVRPGDAPVVYGSWDKAQRAFGYVPQRAFDDTLRATWKHILGEAA